MVLFCLHSLVPLEAELIELVDVYQTLTRWLSSSMLPGFLLLTLTLAFAVLLNNSLAWGKLSLHLTLATLVLVLLTTNLFVTG